MEHRWEFPYTQSRENIGVNADELDNKDSPIQTFVREICQNSNDSAESRPVRIEFKSFQINTEDFPDIDGIRKTLSECQKEVSKIDNNDNAARIMRRRIRSVSSSKMTIMRVSDFNTKGLVGSNTENSAKPWFSLTSGKGISNKKGSAGGSKGRGKDAFYRMSEINTVFFSTKDIEGLEASVGISKQTTHYDSEGKKHDHFGSYGEENGKDFKKQMSLDPDFIRREPGTDIFIPAFREVENSQFQMKLAVIRDFFISIIDGDLEVNINGELINSVTIYHVLDSLNPVNEEDIEAIANTMELIDCYRQGPICKNDDYEVYLRESEKFFRITSVRAGMTIDREFHKMPHDNYVGLIVIRSEDVSALLLKSEDISHNHWNKSIVEDPAERKKVSDLIQKMKEEIRSKVNELVDKEVGDRKDAMGLNRYMPINKEDLAPEVAQKEFLYDNIQKVKTVKKNKPKPKPIQGINSVKPTDPEGDDPDVGTQSNDPVYVNDDAHPSHDPDSERHNASPGDDETFKRAFKERQVKLENIRAICENPEENQYKIMFNTKEKDAIYIDIEALLNDEAGIKIEVSEAWLKDGTPVETAGNRIGPITNANENRNTVNIKLNYPVICRVDVAAVKIKGGESNE